MKLRRSRRQFGATLLVGMIMLVVLTLLVVFSIRSGNTNLLIAGNMQAKAEVNAATAQAIEQVIEQIKVTEDLSKIPAQTIPVNTGTVTYNVAVAPLNKCILEVPVLNSALDITKANDVPCFEGADDDKAIKDDGSLTTKPSACKTQQWEISAGVTDGNTGAQTNHVQGISIRVPATVDCL